MTKQFWAVIIVIIIALVGVFAITNHKNSNSKSTSSSSQPTQHIEGQGKSGVSLVEYGDYECPYCEEYSSIVAQVYTANSSEITFQFRNFPLTSIHPNAFAGARAAEAAGLMGAFWQMHDALYAEGDWEQWSTASDPTPYFDHYATEIGLNLSTFETDFASSTVNNLITADMAAGNKLGIDGTPTFYLDGKQIQVGPTVADFQSVINTAIASKTGSGSTTSTTSSGTTAQTAK